MAIPSLSLTPATPSHKRLADVASDQDSPNAKKAKTAKSTQEPFAMSSSIVSVSAESGTPFNQATSALIHLPRLPSHSAPAGLPPRIDERTLAIVQRRIAMPIFWLRNGNDLTKRENYQPVFSHPFLNAPFYPPAIPSSSSSGLGSLALSLPALASAAAVSAGDTQSLAKRASVMTSVAQTNSRSSLQTPSQQSHPKVVPVPLAAAFLTHAASPVSKGSDARSTSQTSEQRSASASKPQQALATASEKASNLDKASALFSQAQTLLTQSKYRAAIPLLTQIIDLNFDDRKLRYQTCLCLASTYKKIDDFDASNNALDMALHLTEDIDTKIKLLQWMGENFRKQKKWVQAIEKLRTAIRLKCENPIVKAPSYYELAFCCQKMNAKANLQSSIEYLRDALNLIEDKDHPYALKCHHFLVTLLMIRNRQSDPALAKEHCLQGLDRKDPDNALKLELAQRLTYLLEREVNSGIPPFDARNYSSVKPSSSGPSEGAGSQAQASHSQKERDESKKKT